MAVLRDTASVMGGIGLRLPRAWPPSPQEGPVPLCLPRLPVASLSHS